MPHSTAVCGVHTLYGGNVITLTQEYQQGEKALDGHFVLKAVLRIKLPFVVEMCSYPSVCAMQELERLDTRQTA